MPFIAVFPHSQIHTLFLDLGYFCFFGLYFLNLGNFLLLWTVSWIRAVTFIAIFSQSQSHPANMWWFRNYAHAQLFDDSVFMANANFVRSVSFLGERETEYMEIVCSICIFDWGASDWICLKAVCSICISVERESDWIYEDLVFDPRSTPLSLHNSISNQAWGK